MLQPVVQYMKRIFSVGNTPDLWQARFYLLVGIYLIVVLSTFTEYGITIDEPPQAEYGQEIGKWYLSLFRYDEVFDRIKMLDLERYGGFFDTLLYPVTRISPFAPFDTRHLCYALLGLSGIIAVYRLGTTVGSPAIGFLAALFLSLTPRFYGHTFNNPKDLPFAIFYIWSIYFIIQCLRRLPNLSPRLICTTGLVIGLALGTRVGGLILFGYIGLFFFLRYVQIGMQQKVAITACFIRRAFFQIAGIVLIAWVVMLLFWPSAQLSPIFFPFDALMNFSQYGTPDFTTTFFEGKQINITEVPWYYAPKWFLLTLPEFMFLGMVVGAVFVFARWYWLHNAGMKFSGLKLEWGLVSFCAVFPLVYVIVIGTPLYDGLRHLLFVVPPLAVLSAAGVMAAIRTLSANGMRWGMIGLTGILLSLTLWDMIRLHPNEVVYFNRLFAGGLKGASEFYQTDYWENSHKQGLRWLDAYYDQHRPSQKLLIGAGGRNIQYSLNPDRYEFTEILEDADFYLSITRDDRHRLVPGEIVHIIERDSVALLYVIRPDSSYNDDPFFMAPEKRYTLLGWKYAKAGKKEKSVTAYTKALAHDSENALLFNNVAGQCIALKQYEKAEDFSRRATLLMPNYANAYYNLGQALHAQKKMGAAISVYRAYLSLAPEDPDVYLQLADVYQELGYPDSAASAYQRVLAINPGHSDARKGLQTLRIQGHSQSVEAYYRQGNQYRQAGNLDAAVDAYQKALERAPDHTDVLNSLSVTYIQMQEFGSARQLLYKLVQKWPDRTDFRINYSVALFNLGDLGEALRQCRRVIEITPDHAKAYTIMGMVLQEMGERAQAQDAYQQALNFNPNAPAIQALIQELQNSN